MDDLRQYAVFAATVTAGSMSEAARRLRMTPSAVSQTIRALEARTGVTLLHRSTRKLALTEAGERCLPYCRQLLEAGLAAAASLEQARDAPTGELRIAAPIGFATHVAPALAPVLADWPQLRLHLITDDRLIDLVAARIDIALRAGDLSDSRWIGRKLCDFDRILCASPAYLERRGVPALPSDLRAHDRIMLIGDHAPGVEDAEPPMLEISSLAGSSESVRMPVRVGATTMVALQQLCERGMGVAILTYPDAQPLLERGGLVRLLPEWRLPSITVTLVTQNRDGEPAKVRVAVKALRRHFGSLLGAK